MGFEKHTGLVGQTLGSYRLESVLGRGGMGTVYRGTHEKIGRVAAIKVLSDALASNEEFVSRFVNEAKVVNNIRHKSIIDIVEFIEEEQPRRVAYVMELIEGPTLQDQLKQGPLNIIEALNVGMQIASAMKAVHAVGVIHRDLKPENILIDASEDGDLSQSRFDSYSRFWYCKTRRCGGRRPQNRDGCHHWNTSVYGSRASVYSRNNNRLRCFCGGRNFVRISQWPAAVSGRQHGCLACEGAR